MKAGCRFVACDEPGYPPALRAIVQFLRESPGMESLGIGYVALYLRAAPAAEAPMTRIPAWSLNG